MLLLKIGLPTFLLVVASILLLSPRHEHDFLEYSSGAPVSKPPTPVGIKLFQQEVFSDVLLLNLSHSKRDDWSDAVTKGQALYNQILSRSTPPSPFDELWFLTGTWPGGDSRGWSLKGQSDGDTSMSDAGSSGSGSEDDGSSESGNENDEPVQNGTPESYEAPFAALGISQGEDNQNWVASQDLDFANCYGSGKQATDGSFDNYYNVPSRTIVAFQNYSPSYRLKEAYKAYNKPLPADWEKDLPIVSRLSDVLWIVWTDLSQKAGTSPGNLKYIFRHGIVTPETLNILQRSVNSQVPNWPGRRFTAHDTQFMALLATAHGNGVYNLLTQHQRELGFKNIESIIVFKTVKESGEELDNLLFTLTG